jgi:phosphate transport system substrate-binding protein
MKKSYNVYVVLIVSITFFWGCNQKEQKAATLGKMEVWCDESIKKIIAQQEDVFEFSYKYTDIKMNYATEDSVLRKFYFDSVDVIIVSHPLDSIELVKFHKKSYYPRQYQFAVSAVAFITNKSNPKDKVSFEEMKKMLTSNESSQIFVVENKGSGLAHDLLRATKKSALSKNVYALKNKNEVIDYVKNNAGSIGIIDWSDVGDSDDPEAKTILQEVKLVGISTANSKGEYLLPYQYNLNGLYPFTRDLYIIRKKGLNDVSLGFASFVCGERGQKIILKSGLLPKYQTERWIEFKGLKGVEVIK